MSKLITYYLRVKGLRVLRSRLYRVNEKTKTNMKSQDGSGYENLTRIISFSHAKLTLVLNLHMHIR
jgi:hypothetical protein